MSTKEELLKQIQAAREVSSAKKKFSESNAVLGIQSLKASILEVKPLGM